MLNVDANTNLKCELTLKEEFLHFRKKIRKTQMDLVLDVLRTSVDVLGFPAINASGILGFPVIGDSAADGR